MSGMDDAGRAGNAMSDAAKEAAREAAREAERLRTDPAFAGAVGEIRREALEALVLADATDTAGILRLQAEVRAIDRLCGAIAAAILKAREPRRIAL